MIIIGLAGTNGSGKDTIAHLLRDKYGFYFGGATEMLAEELMKQGKPTDRIHKAELAAGWRRQYGMAAIVEKALNAYKQADYKGLVVGSLRHPGETDRVHELGGVQLWVDADPRVRYARITSNNRGRIEDNRTFAEFMAEEQREMTQSGDSATLNMLGVKEKADIYIENNDNDIGAFSKNVEQILRNARLLPE